MKDYKKYLKSLSFVVIVIMVTTIGVLCFYDIEYVYGEDLTGGQSYSESSFQSNVPSSNLYDGNPYTQWVSDTTVPEWVSVEFEDGKQIEKLTLLHVQIYGNTNEFIFQGYDGKDWVDVYRGNCPDRLNVLETFEFKNSRHYNRYRILITSVYGIAGRVSISEIGMMEKKLVFVRK